MTAELSVIEVLPARDVDNTVAELRPLRADAQIAAVTEMLGQSRFGLQVAIAAQHLPSIVEWKAKGAAIQEIAKQLQLGKDMQLDAAEFVRRAERGLGVAIREGQARGTVATNSTAARLRELKKHDVQIEDPGLPGARDLLQPHELYGADGHSGVYAMTDGVSDRAFEESVTEARAEENLSRANVARKTAARSTKAATKRAIDADDPLIDAEVAPPVRKTARARNALQGIAIDLQGWTTALADISPAEVDAEAMREPIESIYKSMGTVNRFLKAVKAGL